MFKLLRSMKKREIIASLIAILLILAQIYFDLTLPDYMSNLTKLVGTPGSERSEIIEVGARMLGCALISMILAVICGYLISGVAAGFGYTIRGRIFDKVSDFGNQEMNGFSVSSLIIRTTNDVTQIQTLLAMGLQMLIKAPVMAVWAVLKIVNKSLELSLVTAGFVAFLLIMMISFLIILLPRYKRVQRMTDDINRIARENISGIRVVHAYNAEDYQNEKFDDANGRIINTQLFNQRLFAAMMPTMSLAMNGLSLAVYWIGASLIGKIPASDVAGRMTLFSDIVVFGTYATYIIMSLMMMVMIFMMLPQAQVSAGRINEILETESTIHSGKATQGPEIGTVEFRDVSFRYPGAAKDTLDDISFKVNKGETIAFIGATGCGKTTLVSLVARFYDATRGSVMVDGVDVRDYSFEALYDKLGYVTQKAVLFSGTVRENVNFGESGAAVSEANAWHALELAQAADFVENMPGKLDEKLEEGGTNVSGGQKQRISIARALARKPEILIFDDSFSALDYKTDAKLRRALKDDFGGTTVMIVAQRIGTIRHADKIVVLDHGRAVGIGTHDELMKNCEVYREIAFSQLSEKELEA